MIVGTKVGTPHSTTNTLAKVEVVKSRAVECLGQIVLATRTKRLPLDTLRGMMTKFMKVMLLSCTSDRFALHAHFGCCEQDVASNKSDTFSECAYTFFSNVVKAYEADTPLVQELANLTLKTLSSADLCEEQFRPQVRVYFAPSKSVARCLNQCRTRRLAVRWLTCPTMRMATANRVFATRSAGALWALGVVEGSCEL